MPKEKSEEQHLTWTHPTKIMVPSPESETLISIRRADWDRIKAMHETRLQIPRLEVLYAILFGIFGTAAFAAIQLEYTPNIPTFVVLLYAFLSVSTLILASVFAILDRRLAKGNKDLHQTIKNEMDVVQSSLVEAQKKAQAN